jgi:hypothetical protein
LFFSLLSRVIVILSWVVFLLLDIEISPSYKILSFYYQVPFWIFSLWIYFISLLKVSKTTILNIFAWIIISWVISNILLNIINTLFN